LNVRFWHGFLENKTHPSDSPVHTLLPRPALETRHKTSTSIADNVNPTQRKENLKLMGVHESGHELGNPEGTLFRNVGGGTVHNRVRSAHTLPLEARGHDMNLIMD
jgi:hypothetical protein